jgi:cytokinin dehydrogenase
MLVEQSPAALASVTEDFGHVLRGSPVGVIHPRSAAEVAEAVTEAISCRTKLTLRGVGHSAGGQALASQAIVVEFSRMSGVGPVDRARGTIRCQPGALLRDVVAATLPHGLLPRALTNLLDLTVGGLLSVGGIGPGSHRHGPLVANVTALEVVTGDGSLRRCSPSEAPDLYQAVLAGLGRCGVIVSAELRLRPVRSRVRTYYLLYDDVQRWMADQRALAHSEQVSAMEGFCSASMQGLRGTGGRRASFAEWFFPLQVSLEFDDNAPHLPGHLSPYRVLHVEDDQIAYFPMRHDQRFEMVRRLGAWERAHPYIGALIGADALTEVLPAMLAALPLFLGHGHCGTFVVATKDVPPLMALPAADDVIFVSVIYPQVLPQFLDATLEAFDRVGELLTAAGGKRYVADWLGQMDAEDWRRHLGRRHRQWLESKRTFDPHDVFCSLLLP